MGALPRKVLFTHLTQPSKYWTKNLQAFSFQWIALAHFKIFDSTLPLLDKPFNLIVSSPTSLQWLKNSYQPSMFSQVPFYCVGEQTKILIENWLMRDQEIFIAQNQSTMKNLLEQYSDRFDKKTIWLGSSQGIYKHYSRLKDVAELQILPTHCNWPAYYLSEQNLEMLQTPLFIICSSISAALSLSSHRHILHEKTKICLSDRRLLTYFPKSSHHRIKIGSWKKFLDTEQNIDDKNPRA